MTGKLFLDEWHKISCIKHEKRFENGAGLLHSLKLLGLRLVTRVP